MPVSSDAVALGPVIAVQSGFGVWGRLARSGVIWAGWYLVWYWPSDLLINGGWTVAIRITDDTMALETGNRVAAAARFSGYAATGQTSRSRRLHLPGPRARRAPLFAVSPQVTACRSYRAGKEGRRRHGGPDVRGVRRAARVVVDAGRRGQPVRAAFAGAESRLGRRFMAGAADAVAFRGAAHAVAGHRAALKAGLPSALQQPPPTRIFPLC